MESASEHAFSQLVDRDHRFEHRHVDAGRRRRLVDDVADLITIAGRAGRSRGQLPVMLLALPAGALADIVDRRRLLIGIQVYLMVVVGALGSPDVAGA